MAPSLCSTVSKPDLAARTRQREKRIWDGITRRGGVDREAIDFVLQYSGSLGLVLEVGCGSGSWTRHLVEVAGRGVIGVDFSSSLIRTMHEELHGPACEAVLADAEYLPFREAVLDQCIFTMSLHHVLDTSSCLRNVAPCLRMGGLILLVEPNGSNPARMFAYGIGVLFHIVRGWKSDPVERPVKIGDTVRTLSRLGFASTVRPRYGRLSLCRATDLYGKLYLLYLRMFSHLLPGLLGSPDFLLVGRKPSPE